MAGQGHHDDAAGQLDLAGRLARNERFEGRTMEEAADVAVDDAGLLLARRDDDDRDPLARRDGGEVDVGVDGGLERRHDRSEPALAGSAPEAQDGGPDVVAVDLVEDRGLLREEGEPEHLGGEADDRAHGADDLAHASAFARAREDLYWARSVSTRRWARSRASSRASPRRAAAAGVSPSASRSRRSWASRRV